MYFSIYFTLINHAVAIAITTSSSRLFARRAIGFRKIRAFVGVSISRCEKECGLRSRCQGVIYRRSYPGCMLISDFQLDHIATDNIGTVLTTGFSDSGVVSCGSNTCSSTETCVEDGNEFACRATECGYFSTFFTSVKGNNYTAASRIILVRGSIKLRVVCGSEGLWEADSSYSAIGHDCTSIFGGSGVYTLSSPVVNVYCDMVNDEGHWTVFQRRQDGTVDFLRGWVDYVAGFGNLEGEFWLGLESLYHILQTGEYELRIDMEAFDGTRRFAKYEKFFLAGQADNYRLTIGEFSGDAGDSLIRHNGMMFSTIDRDNDIYGGHCAQAFKGAWWYVNCHDSNLNGLYPPNGEDTHAHASHIHWKTWLGHLKSPKKTEMKVRRK